MKPQERERVEKFLKARFNAPSLQLRMRPKKDDSAEIYIGDEFIGVLSRDDEDGELCYHVAMTILEMDLEGG